MREPENVRTTADEGNTRRPRLSFLYPGQISYGPVPRTPPVANPGPSLTQVQLPTAAGITELATSITGVALAAFMLMHLLLLSSVLPGRETMDALATFLERYYLLHAGAVGLIILVGAHILFTIRKVPSTFRQQQLLFREMGWLRHFDTWTWAFQVVSAVLILALGSIHLWVILPDLPIEAAKSGTRVFEKYLWFYIPFILLVEGHLSLGLYRVMVKWGLIPRHWAHWFSHAWTVISLVLGAAILVTFYRLGGSL